MASLYAQISLGLLLPQAEVYILRIASLSQHRCHTQATSYRTSAVVDGSSYMQYYSTA